MHLLSGHPQPWVLIWYSSQFWRHDAISVLRDHIITSESSCYGSPDLWVPHANWQKCTSSTRNIMCASASASSSVRWMLGGAAAGRVRRSQRQREELSGGDPRWRWAGKGNWALTSCFYSQGLLSGVDLFWVILSCLVYWFLVVLGCPHHAKSVDCFFYLAWPDIFRPESGVVLCMYEEGIYILKVNNMKHWGRMAVL